MAYPTNSTSANTAEERVVPDWLEPLRNKHAQVQISAWLSGNPPRLVLDNLQVPRLAHRGNRAATEALKDLVDLADRHGVPVEVTPKRIGKNGPDLDKLVEWFGKHDFHMELDPQGNPPGTMVRQPPEREKVVSAEARETAPAELRAASLPDPFQFTKGLPVRNSAQITEGMLMFAASAVDSEPEVLQAKFDQAFDALRTAPSMREEYATWMETFALDAADEVALTWLQAERDRPNGMAPHTQLDRWKGFLPQDHMQAIWGLAQERYQHFGSKGRALQPARRRSLSERPPFAELATLANNWTQRQGKLIAVAAAARNELIRKEELAKLTETPPSRERSDEQQRPVGVDQFYTEHNERRFGERRLLAVARAATAIYGQLDTDNEAVLDALHDKFRMALRKFDPKGALDVQKLTAAWRTTARVRNKLHGRHQREAQHTLDRLEAEGTGLWHDAKHPDRFLAEHGFSLAVGLAAGEKLTELERAQEQTQRGAGARPPQQEVPTTELTGVGADGYGSER